MVETDPVLPLDACSCPTGLAFMCEKINAVKSSFKVQLLALVPFIWDDPCFILGQGTCLLSFRQILFCFQ
jgi:hypothetical protein